MKVAEYKRATNPLAHCAIRIGVDAGAQTGVALYSHEINDWTLLTLNFWTAYDLITKYNPDHTGIVIEVPAGHVVHARKEAATKGSARDKFAANVGSARREAVLLADRFEALGYTVLRVKPSKRKWNCADLQRATGICRRTSQHVRDAVRLVTDHI